MKLSKSVKVDMLKLQQKIYDLHPANSKARQMMIKKEQMLELNSLTLAKNIIFPDDQIQLIVEKLQNQALDAAILGTCGIGGVTVGLLLPDLVSLGTPLGIGSFYLLLSAVGVWSVFKWIQCVIILREIRKIGKDATTITQRIKELTNKIFKDV